MPNNHAPAAWPANRLLAQLPKADLDRLLPHLMPIDLGFKKVLYKAGGPIDYAYFVSHGVASAVAYVGDGTAIEVATVGNEGMLGVSALFADASAPNDVFMQVPGEGLRIAAGVLRRESAPGGPVYQVLVHYLNAYLLQVSQAVACNGLHTVRQRCCKWLLSTHDRVQAEDIPLTHEFLAMMLGVRRASVTEVLQPLHDEGLIRNGRGAITVVDRAGLEGATCECYRIVSDEFARLLG